MPLSEHEQRLLDQIERALYAEDPKFASTVRGGRLRRPTRRRRLQGAALFLLGVVALVLGVMLFQHSVVGLGVSVAGFLLMLVGAVLAVTFAGSRRPTGEQEAAPTGSAAEKPEKERSRFSSRMEERFRRRFEQE